VSPVLFVGAYAKWPGAIGGLKPAKRRALSSTNDNSISVELPTFFVSSSFFRRIETFHLLFGID